MGSIAATRRTSEFLCDYATAARQPSRGSGDEESVAHAMTEFFELAEQGLTIDALDTFFNKCELAGIDSSKVARLVSTYAQVGVHAQRLSE